MNTTLVIPIRLAAYKEGYFLKPKCATKKQPFTQFVDTRQEKEGIPNKLQIGWYMTSITTDSTLRP